MLSNEPNRGYEKRQYLRQYPIVWMCYMKPASLPMMKKGSEGEISPALITRSRSLSNQLKASQHPNRAKSSTLFHGHSHHVRFCGTSVTYCIFHSKVSSCSLRALLVPCKSVPQKFRAAELICGLAAGVYVISQVSS